MASDIDIYTTAEMEAAVVDSATSEASGHPKENLVDNNLDTYWEPTTTANQVIDIDLGSAYQIDSLIVFVNNYTAMVSNGTNPALELRYSDDDVTYTYVGSHAVGDKTAGPLRIYDFSEASAHRYWRLTFTYQNVVINVSGIWLCTKRNLGWGNQWPENDRDQFENQIIQGGAGRDFISALNRNRRIISPRFYVFDGATAFDKLRAAFQDSGGRRWLVIIQEGSAYSDARVVRFASDEFAHQEYQDELYRPTIAFIDEPYIDDGDTY